MTWEGVLWVCIPDVTFVSSQQLPLACDDNDLLSCKVALLLPTTYAAYASLGLCHWAFLLLKTFDLTDCPLRGRVQGLPLKGYGFGDLVCATVISTLQAWDKYIDLSTISNPSIFGLVVFFLPVNSIRLLTFWASSFYKTSTVLDSKGGPISGYDTISLVFLISIGDLATAQELESILLCNPFALAAGICFWYSSILRTPLGHSLSSCRQAGLLAFRAITMDVLHLHHHGWVTHWWQRLLPFSSSTFNHMCCCFYKRKHKMWNKENMFMSKRECMYSRAEPMTWKCPFFLREIALHFPNASASVVQN